MKYIFQLLCVSLLFASCSQKTSQTESSNDKNPETIVEVQDLVLGADLEGSSAETIVVGPVAEGQTLTKRVYIKNTSGYKLQLSMGNIATELAKPENSRWSYTTNCGADLRHNNSCYVVFSLSYKELEDYNQSVVVNVVSGLSNPEYGKFLLQGSKAGPVLPTIQMGDKYNLSKPVLSYVLSETKLVQEERVYLINKDTFKRPVPQITFPSSVEVTANTCTLKTEFRAGESCYFNLKATYSNDPGKASISEYVTFSLPTDPSIDTANFRVAINITNEIPPVQTNKVQISQSTQLSDLSSLGTFRIYVKNISTTNVNTAITNLPIHFQTMPTSNCLSSSYNPLRAGRNCYYDIKLVNTNTLNMAKITKIITIDGTDGFIYAGLNPNKTLVNEIICKSGFQLSGELCIEATAQLCDLNNSVGNGLLSINNVLSVKGNTPNCLVDTCQVGYTKSGDEKTCEISQTLVSETKRSIDILRSSENCSFDVSTVGTTTLNNALVVNSATSPLPNQADQHAGQVRFDLNQSNINITSNCLAGTTISAIKEYNKPIASIQEGYWQGGNDDATLQSDLEHMAVLLNFQLISNYTIYETERGITESELATYIVNDQTQNFTIQSRQAYSKKIYFSKAYGGSDGSSVFLVIPNGATSVIYKLGETYKKNISSTFSEDFGFIPNTARIGVDNGVQPSVLCSPAVGNQSCSIASLNDNVILAFSTQELSYPITIEVVNSANNDRIDMQATTEELKKVNVTSMDAVGGIFSNPYSFSRSFSNQNNSFNINTTFIDKNTYTNDECMNYAGLAGTSPLHPKCYSLKISDVYTTVGYTLPDGVEFVSNLGNTHTFQLKTSPLPSLTSNHVKILMGKKEDSIESDLQMADLTGYGPEKYIAILPQEEDKIQTTIQFYEKNLDRKISKVELKIHKDMGGNNYQDFSSNFIFTCLGTSNSSTINAGDVIDFNSEEGKTLGANCFNVKGVQASFTNYPSSDLELMDLYRTGSYKLIYTVESVEISDSSSPRTKVIEQLINISPDNDFTPSLTITNNANGNYIADHEFLRNGSRAVSLGNNGKYYAIGSSVREYSDLTSVSTTVPFYRNQDYNWKLKTIPSGTQVKAFIDMNSIPEDKKSIAHNAYLRIFDPRNNGSCRMLNKKIGSDLINFNNPANRRTVSQLDAGEDLTFAETYTMNSLSENLVLASGNRGCTQAAGSTGVVGISTTTTPWFGSEKYDFIGNDDQVCHAGEVCYVNSATSTVDSTLKVGLRTYKVRAFVRSENNEVNYVDQLVNVEQPLSGVDAEAANVNISITPKVDSRMGDDVLGFRINENYVLANNDSSFLTWIDYKTPVNSIAKYEVSVSGIDCSSGCEYSFVEYGGVQGDSTYDKTLYKGNTMADSTHQPFSTSTSWVASAYEPMIDNNMEVLVLVKKNNAVYRKLINMAIPNKVRSESVMYAIKSEYSAGQFQGFKFIYDLNKYGTDTNGADIIETAKTPNKLLMSVASYPETIRNAFASGLPQEFTPNANASIHMTNYQSGGHLFNGFSPASANLDFYKLGKVVYDAGTPDEDYFHWYFRFKQCPEATPYFYYNDVSGWSCKSQAQAQADMWSL